jgi:hypothetical protein
MNAEADLRFDIDAVAELAGSQVFARGEAYSRDGRVRILAADAVSVRARVTGSQDYRVELTGRGATVGGTCTCPAFEDQVVCKHMVATALAVNGAGGGAEDLGGLARIRAYLGSRPVDELVGIIMGRVANDAGLLRRLDVAALSLDVDNRRLEPALRQAIDTATRTAGFIDYDGAGGWATEVTEALDRLADISGTRHAALALDLAMHAIDRIEGAIEYIDDSNGECSELLARARAIHLAAARTARPDPVALAHDLFTRETEDEYDTFRGAAVLYAHTLGEAGLAEYRRLATAAWEALPPRTSNHREAVAGDYSVLAEILDFFAERDGDLKARITLRAKDLSSPWQYLQLAEFCLGAGREDEALRRAEEGLWMFEGDRPDERLVLFAAGLLVKSGRDDKAQEHLTRAFEKAPSLALYTRLHQIGGATAREMALYALEARAARQQERDRHHSADLLIQILTREEAFGAAWIAVRKHGASDQRIQDLAKASEATHPNEALEAHARHVDQLIGLSGNRAYAEAAILVGRMARLRGEPEQAAYIAELKLRFGRKRNFMKLLA